MSGAGIVGVSTGPYQYLDPQGVIIPDTADIQTDVEQEFKDGLGQDLDVTTPGTPQYVLIKGRVVARSEVVANNAAVANQINPDISGGIFLEALCSLTGVDIPQATPSIVFGVAVKGQPFATIPAASQAETEDDNGDPTGDIFRTTEQVQFDVNGNGVVNFESQENGPVACTVGQLRRIVSDVLGWETIYNSNAATLGTLSPSDAQIRTVRNNTLAAQGQSLPEAVTSAVLNPALVPGVRSMKFRNNKVASPQTINGIAMKANSVWCCVQGGSDANVALAIYNSVGGGCDFNGAVSVSLTDPTSGQVEVIQFDRPTAVAILVKATVVLPNSAVTVAQVTQAILDYAAGLISGQPGFIVGGSVSPFDIAGAVVVEVNGVYVRKLEVALKSDGIYGTNEIALTLTQLATLASSDIAVVPVT